MKSAAKIIHGKRKSAIARIQIKPGKGSILVNGLDYKAYFKRKAVAADVVKPLELTSTLEKYDILVNVQGGGLSGQAGAVRHAIANAINVTQPESRGILKVNGYLTRDSRVVQRKMYGHKKARKSFQFSKR